LFIDQCFKKYKREKHTLINNISESGSVPILSLIVGEAPADLGQTDRAVAFFLDL
jgi:hypothetical protein